MQSHLLPRVHLTRTAILTLFLGLLLSKSSWSQEGPSPSRADVRYGPHERNVLDFWQAPTDHASPLVIYIHGGGFRNGSKSSLGRSKVKQFLDSGISVAALNYRLLAQDFLPAAHHDCRRAVQFLRAQAEAWKLDAKRFGAFGGSAGAQICMYLAFHDDMADPDSPDPLVQQSTRVQCVATSGGQTTMDFAWWFDNIPGYRQPHRLPSEYFGPRSQEQRSRIIRDIAALSLLTSDDPPIFMRYRMAPDDPLPSESGRLRGWQVHHVNFGVALAQRAAQVGVRAYLHYPGADTEFTSDVDFFRTQLLGADGHGS